MEEETQMVGYEKREKQKLQRETEAEKPNELPREKTNFKLPNWSTKWVVRGIEIKSYKGGFEGVALRGLKSERNESETNSSNGKV